MADPVQFLLRKAGDLDADRRAALRTLGRGLGMVATGCIGGMVSGLLSARPGAAWATRGSTTADTVLDVQILQTASSLETLLVDLYAAALGTGPLGTNDPSAKALTTMADAGARNALVRLLTETQAQHREHRVAFQALTTALGGKVQNGANPKYLSGAASADLSNPLRLVDYAAVLEKILTDTYVVDLTMAESVKAKETLAAVMAVEAQHLAAFRVAGALLRDETPQLLRLPIGVDLANLPAALAAIAFPESVGEISAVAEPESGALP